MKKRFEVKVLYDMKKSYQLDVVIEANSEQEALEKINKMHKKGKLCYDEAVTVAVFDKIINIEETYIKEVKIEDSKL